MSGGAFDYNQYKIGYIADQIDEVIVKNGLEKTPEELNKKVGETLNGIKNTLRIYSITNIRMRLLRR